MSKLSLFQLLTQRKLTYPYSLLFGFFSGSLLALWSTAYVASQGQNFQYRYAVDNFGQAMADMVAQQAMDSTLNHDRLSLQILLEDLTLHQAVVNSAIYDVENKLIVQAGETGNQLQGHIQHFSAPIALHDTISGYVVLAIDTAYPNSTLYTVLLIMITSALVGAAGFCAYRGMSQNQIAANEEVKKSKQNSINSENREFDNQKILLTLTIKNFDDLYEKLNNDSRKKIIGQLSQHLQKALSLYSGDLVYLGTGTIVLSFGKSTFEKSSYEKYDFERNNFILNAVCCGYIIRELNKKQSNFPLVLSAQIHHISIKPTVEEESLILRNNTTDSATGLTIEKILLKGHHLESYFMIDSEENPTRFIDIQGFQAKYAELLDNQIEHLCNENQ